MSRASDSSSSSSSSAVAGLGAAAASDLESSEAEWTPSQENAILRALHENRHQRIIESHKEPERLRLANTRHFRSRGFTVPPSRSEQERELDRRLVEILTHRANEVMALDTLLLMLEEMEPSANENDLYLSVAYLCSQGVVEMRTWRKLNADQGLAHAVHEVEAGDKFFIPTNNKVEVCLKGGKDVLSTMKKESQEQK